MFPHLDFFLYLLNRSYLNRIFSTWFATFVANFIAMDQVILRIYVFAYVSNIVEKVSNDTFLEYSDR